MFKLISTSDDFKFKHPFSCLGSGTSGSGKSSFCLRFLQNLDALCTERNFVGGLIGCYSEQTSVPNQQLAVLKKNIGYNEDVPPYFENAHGRLCLIILDDLLNDTYSKEVCDLFIKGSHHRNIGLIFITQNLFHQGRYCRNILLNAKYLVLWKTSGKKSFHVLGPSNVSRK